MLFIRFPYTIGCFKFGEVMKAVSVVGLVGTVILCMVGCSNNEQVTASEPVVTTEAVIAESELAAQNMTNSSNAHAVEPTESGNQTAEQKAGQDQQY